MSQILVVIKGEGENMTLGVADLKHYFDNIIVISLIMGITYICKYGVIFYFFLASFGWSWISF